MPRALARWVLPLCKTLHNGKTHLAVSLGLKAIQRRCRALFTTAAALIANLNKAYAENRLEENSKPIVSPKFSSLMKLAMSPLTFMAHTFSSNSYHAAMRKARLSSPATGDSASGAKSLVTPSLPPPS